ncbi:HIT-like protein, partial [Cystobasidium minutum MCA 4210]|uniref:HIT-like protein n=1 Tax=Cystobasidium minutum MCA 4210 TaxID=1397322 RepID=UPI0034CD16C5
RMSWKNALVDYAKTKNPSSLPDDILLMHTKQTLTIWDKYPKAKFHFLTLPRLPFIEPGSGDELTQATLDSLSALLANKHALKVLKILKDASDEVKEQIEDEMLKREGFIWPISVGFHAIESMSHVHLHVISQDFLSDSLKNKKHWNSFNPSHGFFLHLEDMIDWVQNRTLKQHNKSKKAYEELLKSDMQCHKCEDSFPTIPALKRHLEGHFAKYKQEHLPLKRKLDSASEQKHKRSRSNGNCVTEVDQAKAHSGADEREESP